MRSLICFVMMVSVASAANDTWLAAGHVDRESEVRPYVEIWDGTTPFSKDEDDLDYYYWFQQLDDGDSDQTAEAIPVLTKPNNLKASADAEAWTYIGYDGPDDEYQLLSRADFYNLVHGHDTSSGPSATARSRCKAKIMEDYLCWSTDGVASGKLRFDVYVDPITNADQWWMSGLKLEAVFGKTTITYTFNTATDYWSYTISGVKVVGGQEQPWNESDQLQVKGLDAISNISHPVSQLVQQGQFIECWSSINPLTNDLLNNYLYTKRDIQHIGPDKHARVHVACEVAVDSN